MPPVLALTFLDPAAGIIAAGIGVPILLLYYFLRLRRRPLRISSTVLWVRAAQDLQVNAPFQWIRPSWLLLVQLAILACLCLAVARPAIDRPTTEADRVVVIVDTSASMRATDGGSPTEHKSRFVVAQARAKELVSRLPSSAEIMLVSSAADAITLSPFTRDRGAIRASIDEMDATDQPGNLGAALALVAAADAQTASESDEGLTSSIRAIILSDAGGASESALTSAGRAAVELARIGPEPGGPRDNLGILSLAARRDYDDPTIVRLFLRIGSWRDLPSTTSIRVDLDGEEASLQTVEVPAAADGLPGDASVTIELDAPAASLVTITIQETDLLESDNVAAIRLGDAAGPRVLLVQPSSARTNAEVALIEAVETLDAITVTRMTADDFNALPPSDAAFRTHDMVILDRVVPTRLPPIPSLSFDATLPIPGLEVSDATVQSEQFAFWERSHPVLRYVQLGDVDIISPSHLQAPDDGLRTSSGVVRTQVIATGSSGPLMMVLEQGSIRRILVAFALERSDWWKDASFPIFIANAVEFLSASARPGTGVALTTVEPLSFPAPAETEAVVTGAGGFSRRSTATSEGIARFGPIPFVGFYTVTINGAGAGAIATNLLSESESSLATGNELIVGGRQVRAGSIEGMAPREIRDWLIAAAIVLLALEWALFAWRMRV